MMSQNIQGDSVDFIKKSIASSRLNGWEVGTVRPAETPPETDLFCPAVRNTQTDTIFCLEGQASARNRPSAIKRALKGIVLGMPFPDMGKPALWNPIAVSEVNIRIFPGDNEQESLAQLPALAQNALFYEVYRTEQAHALTGFQTLATQAIERHGLVVTETQETARDYIAALHLATMRSSTSTTSVTALQLDEGAAKILEDPGMLQIARQALLAQEQSEASANSVASQARGTVKGRTGRS